MSNLYWIANDTRGFSSEDTVLLSVAGQAYHNFHNGIFDFRRDIFYAEYPPLVPSLVFLFYLLFGPSDKIHLYVNLLFAPVLFLSVYFAGKHYSKSAGKTALAILLGFPIVFILSRVMYEQFILISLYALSIALLLRTNYFSDRKYCVLYGVSVGLCLLARHTSIPALLSFFLGYATVGVYSQKKPALLAKFTYFLNNRRQKCLFLIFLTILLVAGIWYLPKLGFLHKQYFDNPDNGTGGHQDNIAYTLERIKCYLLYVPSEMLGLLNSMLLFILGVISLLFLKKQGASQVFLLSFPYLLAIIIPIFFVSAIPVFAVQTMGPAAVSLAILLGIALSNFKGSWKKIFFFLILMQPIFLLLPIEQGSGVYNLVYNLPALEKPCMNKLCTYFLPVLRPITKTSAHLNPYNLLIVSREDYNSLDLYNDIKSFSGEGGERALFIFSTPYVSPQVLHHYQKLKAVHFGNYLYVSQVIPPAYLETGLEESDIKAALSQFNFIIIPTGINRSLNLAVYPEDIWRYMFYFREYLEKKESSPEFEVVSEYRLPKFESKDDFYSEMHSFSLYKRKRS